MSQRKIVYTRLSHDFDVYCDPTLKDLLEDVQELIAKFGDDVSIEFTVGVVILRIPREETDTEMNTRILIEQQVKDHQRRKDLEQYESLKKKLGLD
jgi:hypothetical protein